MRFQIDHVTRYRYERRVFLGPQVLRLTPRTDANQRLLQFELRIDPEPAGRTDLVDLDGNTTTSIWFPDRVDRLTIEASALVETLRSNPFDYLWQGAGVLPLHYEPRLASLLKPYRQGGTDGSVQALAESVAASVGEQAQVFPSRLAAVLHDDLRTIVRREGEPLPASETLALGEGSCRDLAVLFIEVCRQVGFAARFVSGYHTVAGDEHDLHAWPELYLPGGGWRGYDPTTGLAVADRHIALAAGAEAWQAAPVSGTFRSRHSSYLEATVSVQAVD
jgi:transglutaminase-like putative cysteine protease